MRLALSARATAPTAFRATVLTSALTCAALTVPAAAQQELLHYKFDAGCNSKVINYATSGAPSEGTVVSGIAGAPATSWKPGVWGNALVGAVQPAHNYVDTGYAPAITGSLTWAFWLKMDPAAPTPSLSYVMGAGGGSSFRVFTGGGGFFLTSSWGGSNLNTTAHVQNMAKLAWTHLALVIDATALTGTYYINGVPEPAITITGGANIAGTSFYVGTYSGNTTGSIFDMDEYLLVNRALTAAEILILASTPRAGDAAYGGGCGALQLGSTGGRPALGNSGYMLQLTTPNVTPFALGLGSNRCKVGPVLLPLDLGTLLPPLSGCVLDASMDLLTLGGVVATGMASLRVPIPNLPQLQGLTLYLQASGNDAATSKTVLSNAFSMSLGS